MAGGGFGQNEGILEEYRAGQTLDRLGVSLHAAEEPSWSYNALI